MRRGRSTDTDSISLHWFMNFARDSVREMTENAQKSRDRSEAWNETLGLSEACPRLPQPARGHGGVTEGGDQAGREDSALEDSIKPREQLV